MRAAIGLMFFLSAVAVLAQGPVLRLSFDEGAGDAAKDVSGQISASITRAQWVQGISGSALSFSKEAKSAVVVKNAAAYTPASISISLWMKPSAKQNDAQLIVKMAGSGKAGYRINTGGDSIQWQIPNEERAWNYGLNASEKVNIGAWNYVVTTYDGNTMRVYINGKPAGTMPRAGSIVPSGNDLIIGAFSADGSHGFTGIIDEVRIYNREITGEEIMKTYDIGMKKLNAALAAPKETAAAAAPVTGTPPTVKKMLVLGDSITKHGPAVEKLGWSGNWGMAASSEDKDYVHLLYAKLCDAQPDNKPELLIDAVGGGTITGKLAAIEKITASAAGADLAVIQLGENDRDATEAGFEKPYEKLITALKQMNPSIRIYCCSAWRSGAAKDTMIKNVCTRMGVVYVDITSVHSDPAASAESEKRFSNGGVNWHPGDKGMQGYADMLWKAMKEQPVMPAPKAVTVADVAPVVKNIGTIFEDNFDGGNTKKWQPEALTFEPGKSGSALAIVAVEAKGNSASVMLPVETLRGKKIEVSVLVKAENVSDKPKSYNGIKCMLVVKDAESRMDYPQAPVGTGTFDWQRISFTYTVHEMAISIGLTLGLEAVTGKVLFDDLKIVDISGK
ncbi:MAG: hypothetical protein HZC28_11670 [Spirochaetes bacterium]|nr:hypothetical protein [Spirochaetota bacterium]